MDSASVGGDGTAGSATRISLAVTVVGSAAKPRTLMEWTRAYWPPGRLVALDARQQLGQRHPGLHAGQRRAHAEVPAAAEADEVLTCRGRGRSVGSAKTAWSRLADPIRSSMRRSGLDVDALDGRRAGSSPARSSASRCRSAASPRPSRGSGPGRPAAWPARRVAPAPVPGVGQQLGGRLVPGHDHQEEEADDLVVGQPVAVDLGLQQRHVRSSRSWRRRSATMSA